MVDVETFRELCLSFPDATEEPHFEKVSFRIRKKIFATLDLEKHTAVLKLTEDDQANYSEQNDTVIYPVKGAWGKKGWTVVVLQKVSVEVIKEALATAYHTVTL